MNNELIEIYQHDKYIDIYAIYIKRLNIICYVEYNSVKCCIDYILIQNQQENSDDLIYTLFKDDGFNKNYIGNNKYYMISMRVKNNKLEGYVTECDENNEVCTDNRMVYLSEKECNEIYNKLCCITFKNEE